MDAILRGVVVYLLLLIIFRIAGKRSLAEVTTFDLVLTLIISESIQQALIDGDDSLTNAFLVVIALVGSDILLSHVKQRWPRVEHLLQGMPMVILEDGKPKLDRMGRERVDEQDILQAARQQEGLRSLEELDYAVLEPSGDITVVPKRR
jgi:uncharacterized membrane protein YcaP (DUF421 family)